jgi:hypothetical protein
MTKMPVAPKVLALAVAMVVSVAGAISAHSRVEVLAVDSNVTESNGVATATFKLLVTNQEESAITSVRAVFAGGFEVSIGDIAAGKTATSAGQKLVFNAADLAPTKNVPVTVTLKYTTDAGEQTASALLTLRRAE